MTEEAPDQQMQQTTEAAPVQENGVAPQAAPAQPEVVEPVQQEAPAEAVEPVSQPAAEVPQEDQNQDGEEKAPAEQANGETTPTPATGGATTRQRSGKATPAKPQQPKLAPRPISKAKKSKKGKGKGAAAKKTLMTLHGYWRSGCSWRVRLALGLKSFALGKEIDFVPVHLVKEGGEQKTEAYSKLNPAQMVPTLIVKDKNITKKPVTLTESMAICEYLEEVYPSKRKLLPKDPIKRFQVRRLCEMINAGCQPAQNLAMLQEIGGRFGAEHKQPWASFVLTRGLTAFEAQVEQTKGKYCLGNILTLADVFLPSAVFSAERYQVDMSQFPGIMSIMDNLKTIPEFVAAHPSQQPDAEQ